MRHAAALILLAGLAGVRAESIVLLPAQIDLRGPTARQTLLVEKKDGQHFTGEIAEAVLESSDEAVVKIEHGAAHAVGDGKARITARRGAQLATAEVTVRGTKHPPETSFRHHIQPLLAKTGCSLGACHGAAAGQGGFRLSLRGYDDEGDYLTLTRGAFSRRITPSDPARSLLLLKPANLVPHKGGEKFKIGSPEWTTLVDWIANGVPGPAANDPRVERVESLPAHVRLAPGAKQRFIVRAHFTDGHSEEVTRFVKWTAVNQSVINVDEEGRATVVGKGESALSAWVLQQIAVATVTAPFASEIAPEPFTKAPRRNWIDELVLEKLQALSLPPSPQCTDHEFIRRAFIDTLGVLPTAEETRAFLAEREPGKRDRLIESLLKRPEFIDYWSYKWSDLLLVTKRKLKPAAMWSYYQWIRDQVASNTPWDLFAKRLLTAQGSSLENGAANYFVIHQDPRELAETTSQTFLGFSMNCAKCHNHPMEKWTNNDYYGFANLFSRVRFKAGAQDGENIVFAAEDGELVQPLTGKPQPPRPLDGKAIPFEVPGDRREAMATWLVSPENHYFKRAIVNRVWANFFAVGLVESVDDIRVSNPSTNEALLTRAAEFLVEQNFDLQALIRAILQSETYQRSSVPIAGNEADTRFYSRYYPRRMMAEVLHDAIVQVTNVPTPFKTKDPTVEGDKPLDFPRGWRAVQLPDASTDSYFTKVFGRPAREATCECERTAEPSVTQALHVSNGDTINRKLTAPEGAVNKALSSSAPIERMIEEAYLAALSRPPSPPERERIAQLFAGADEKEKRALLEDTYWALLSTNEFLFNH